MGAGSVEPSAPTLAELERAVERLAALDALARPMRSRSSPCLLERVKGALAAAQARVTDNLAGARTAREAERGVPP